MNDLCLTVRLVIFAFLFFFISLSSVNYKTSQRRTRAQKAEGARSESRYASPDVRHSTANSRRARSILIEARPLSSTQSQTTMPSARDYVNEMIAKDSIVIFSKTYCPYCKMAKEVFDKLNKNYTAVELDNMDDADEIQNVLGEITGARTVPRVFVNGTCLGGGSDVKKMYESGELVKKF